MIDPTIVSQAIEEHLSRSPSQQAVGAVLGHELRRRFPGFSHRDYGVPGLREFIQKYAKNVCEVGRSGGDYRFELTRPGTVSSGGASMTSVQQEGELDVQTHPSMGGGKATRVRADVWKIYTNPNSRQLILLSKSPLQASIQPADGIELEAVAEGRALIHPASAEKHLEIARGFVNGLENEEQKAKLTQILDGSARWWTEFFATADSLGLLQSWIRHRGRSLLKELSATAGEQGFPISIVQSHSLPEQADGPHTQRSEAMSLARTNRSLRAVALEVVRRMSDDELRDLKVRLGMVFDLLASDKQH